MVVKYLSRILILSCTVLIFLFLAPKIVYAAEVKSAGKVLMVKGQVIAQKGATKRTLKRRDPVYAGEIIITGNNSKAQIRFKDGGLLLVQENTKFKINSFKFEKDAKDNESKMSLITGGFKSLSGRIADQNPEKYSVTTELATMGVRGTFWGAILDTTASTPLSVSAFQDTRPGAKDSKVFIENDAGTTEIGFGQPVQNAGVASRNSPIVPMNQPSSSFDQTSSDDMVQTDQAEPRDSDEAPAIDENTNEESDDDSEKSEETSEGDSSDAEDESEDTQDSEESGDEGDAEESGGAEEAESNDEAEAEESRSDEAPTEEPSDETASEESDAAESDTPTTETESEQGAEEANEAAPAETESAAPTETESREVPAETAPAESQEPAAGVTPETGTEPEGFDLETGVDELDAFPAVETTEAAPAEIAPVVETPIQERNDVEITAETSGIPEINTTSQLETPTVDPAVQQFDTVDETVTNDEERRTANAALGLDTTTETSTETGTTTTTAVLTESEISDLTRRGVVAYKGSSFAGPISNSSAGDSPIITNNETISDATGILRRNEATANTVGSASLDSENESIENSTWNATSSNPARLFTDPDDNSIFENITNQVFWAARTPTSSANLPTGRALFKGNFSNTSAPSSPSTLAFRGGINDGSNSIGSIDTFSLEFVLDFDTSKLSNLILSLQGNSGIDQWSASGSGTLSSVNFSVPSLSASHSISGVSSGSATGSLQGFLSGASGQGAIGSFHLTSAVGGFDNHAEGIFGIAAQPAVQVLSSAEQSEFSNPATSNRGVFAYKGQTGSGLSTTGSGGNPTLGKNPISNVTLAGIDDILKKGNASLDGSVQFADINTSQEAPVIKAYYGEWDASDSNKATLFTNPANDLFTTDITDDILWATSLAASPIGNIPRSGSVTYHAGFGDVSAPSSYFSKFDGSGGTVNNLEFKFDLDFGSGAITNVLFNAQTVNGDVWNTTGITNTGTLNITHNALEIPNLQAKYTNNGKGITNEAASGSVSGYLAGSQAQTAVTGIALKHDANSDNHIEGVIGVPEYIVPQ